MDQIQYQRELLSFSEKIALAKLEESKASERVRELEYQRARFSLDIYMQSAKEQEATAQQPKPESAAQQTQQPKSES